MMQAEKALRDAGWVEITLNVASVGDEIYDIPLGDNDIVEDPPEPYNTRRVLRAPRSRLKYEVGTLAEVRWVAEDEEFLAWATNDDTWCDPLKRSFNATEVQVLRVLGYPDRSTHRPGDSFGQCVTDVDAASERANARAREILERF